MNLFFHEAARIGAVAKHHVLQFALAALVADWAIERVIRQEKFEHAFAGLLDLRRIRANDHAFCGSESASRLQLGHFFHFNEAHAARGLQRKARVIAERRNFRRDLLGGFDDQLAGRNLKFAVVDFYFYELLFSHDPVYRAPSNSSLLALL